MLLVFLPPQMQQQLEERAHRDGTNMANVARKAIDAYLRRVRVVKAGAQ